MDWTAENVNIEKLNNGAELTNATRVTPDLFNSVVQLLFYLKEV